MKYIINHWYLFSVYIAGIFALILGMGQWNHQMTVLLLAMIFIHLHFFEEFGLPGGFAWGGLKVEGHAVDADVSKWILNQTNSMWGNNWFAVAVYLLSMFTPQWHWTMLAAVIFAFVELLGHVIVFPIGLKGFYNPGLFTAVCLGVISVWYLTTVDISSLYSWWDLLIAFIWIIFNYWMAFLGPIPKHLAKNKKYAFTREDLLKSKNTMARFNVSIDDFHNFGD